MTKEKKILQKEISQSGMSKIKATCFLACWIVSLGWGFLPYCFSEGSESSSATDAKTINSTSYFSQFWNEDSVLINTLDISYYIVIGKIRIMKTDNKFDATYFPIDVLFSEIISNKKAYAGITQNGDLVTLGDPFAGGTKEYLESFDPLQDFKKGILPNFYFKEWTLWPTGDPDSRIEKLFSSATAFAGLLHDGSVISWGAYDYDFFQTTYGYQTLLLGETLATTPRVIDPKKAGVKVVDVVTNLNAFVALMEDGSLYAWGEPQCGGASGAEAQKIPLPKGRHALRVTPTTLGFVAELDNHSLYTWGTFISSWPYCWDKRAGTTSPSDLLKCNQWEQMLTKRNIQHYFDPGTVFVFPKQYQNEEIIARESNASAVAFHLRSQEGDQETIVCWGSLGCGGGSTLKHHFRIIPLPKGKKGKQLAHNEVSFALLLDDGTAICWGDQKAGGNGTWSLEQPILPPTGTTITTIIPGTACYTALLNNQQLFCWGNELLGGKTPTNEDGTPIENIIDVVHAKGSFFARTKEERLIFWGGSFIAPEEVKPFQNIIPPPLTNKFNYIGSSKLYYLSYTSDTTITYYSSSGEIFYHAPMPPDLYIKKFLTSLKSTSILR